MKIRFGFVSNSSSTSYVISIDVAAHVPCPTCGGVSADLLGIMNSMRMGQYSEDTEVKATGAADVVRYIKDHWFTYEEESDGDKLVKRIVKDMKAAEKLGRKVAYVSISYHDDVTKALFEALKERKKVDVIYCDHG